jgi:hypothetical protein
MIRAEMVLQPDLGISDYDFRVYRHYEKLVILAILQL